MMSEIIDRSAPDAPGAPAFMLRVLAQRFDELMKMEVPLSQAFALWSALANTPADQRGDLARGSYFLAGKPAAIRARCLLICPRW